MLASDVKISKLTFFVSLEWTKTELIKTFESKNEMNSNTNSR